MALPFHEKYPMPAQNIYNGIYFPGGEPASLTKESFKKIRNFQVRDNDVITLAYPRTGKRWTTEVISWIIDDCDEEKMSNTSNTERVFALEYDLPSANIDILSRIPSSTTRIYSTHLTKDLAPAQIENGRIIIPIRNPKDNAVSCFYFLRLLKFYIAANKAPWNDFLQGYSDGSLAWGSYFDWLKSWWPMRHHENVLVLKYEESKKDSMEMVRKIAAFLGKTLTEEQVQLIVEKTSFSAMKNSPNTNFQRDPKFAELFDEEEKKRTGFVRKGEVGDWKNHFTVKQNEVFDELIKEKLAGLDLQFKYEH